MTTYGHPNTSVANSTDVTEIKCWKATSWVTSVVLDVPWTDDVLSGHARDTLCQRIAIMLMEVEGIFGQIHTWKQNGHNDKLLDWLLDQFGWSRKNYLLRFRLKDKPNCLFWITVDCKLRSLFREKFNYKWMMCSLKPEARLLQLWHGTSASLPSTVLYPDRNGPKVW